VTSSDNERTKLDSDLTFSASFVDDLENDPKFVSALDKLEKDFVGSENIDKRQDKQPQGTHKTFSVGSSIKLRTNINNENKEIQRNINESNAKLSVNLIGQGKPTTSNKVKEVLVRNNVGNKTPVLASPVAQASNHGGHFKSFHDLSFDSPIDISTPQILKGKKTSTHLSSTKVPPSASKSRKSKSSQKVKTPQSTPRRSRNSSLSKPQCKKQVLAGLIPSSPNYTPSTSKVKVPVNRPPSEVNGQSDKPDTSEVADQSDFFRSLCVESESINVSHGGSVQENCGDEATGANSNDANSENTVKPKNVVNNGVVKRPKNTITDNRGVESQAREEQAVFGEGSGVKDTTCNNTGLEPQAENKSGMDISHVETFLPGSTVNIQPSK